MMYAETSDRPTKKLLKTILGLKFVKKVRDNLFIYIYTNCQQ